MRDYWGTKSGRQLGIVGLSGKQWERLGKAHLELTRRQRKDHMCKTSARQLGGKWGTTSERPERQLGNNRATNGRHVEIIGKPILGNKSELSKVSI